MRIMRVQGSWDEASAASSSGMAERLKTSGSLAARGEVAAQRMLGRGMTKRSVSAGMSAVATVCVGELVVSDVRLSRRCLLTDHDCPPNLETGGGGRTGCKWREREREERAGWLGDWQTG